MVYVAGVLPIVIVAPDNKIGATEPDAGTGAGALFQRQIELY